MIVTLLDLFLLFIAVFKYINKQYVLPVVIFAFYVSDAFIISFGGITPVVKHWDFALIQIVIISVISLGKGIAFFSLKKDRSAKIILLFVLFFAFQFVRSVVSGFESFDYAFKDVRYWFLPLSYFMLRRIPLLELEKAGAIIFKLTALSVLLFVLQYITRVELVNTYIGKFSEDYRMQVVPPFLEFFLLYLFFKKERLRFRFLYVGLILLVLYISQNRTQILTLGLMLGVYLLIKGRMKQFWFTTLAILIILPVFTSLFKSRSEDKTSVFDSQAINMVRTFDYNNVQKENSFYFRIAILLERGEYLLNHPNKILLGVGTIHEDSPNNNFNFSTGTYRDTGKGRTQLKTLDVMWCSPLIQFGLLGVLLMIYVFWYCIKTFFKNRDDFPQMISFLVFLGFVLASFSSNSLVFSYNLFFMSVMLAYNYRSITENKIKTL